MVFTYDVASFWPKMDEALIHATTWRNLESGMLSKRSQTQTIAYCMIFFKYKISRISKSIEIESRLVVAWK